LPTNGISGTPRPACWTSTCSESGTPPRGGAYNGAGTSTVVIDDGFDYFHADLLPNFRQDLDFDFESGRQDSFGVSTSSHGTAVAGIIGAAANGFGTVGVAHETEIIGYRTEQRLNNAFLEDVRDAPVTALADVANISMGIANDLDSEFGSGFSPGLLDQIEVSIGTAVARGRDGLGMTIVKSAGNSRGDSYDVNADDWSNDTRQVVVAAVDQDGFVSEYSSFGAANLVSGFGTPGEVFTTDRRGFAGYEASDFTDDFNGTSSAAPMVAGVVALIYDANAGLGWRDVQSILAVSARHVGTEVGGGTAGHERFAWHWNGARTWNGGGQHFSNDYGYGLVDALAAVRLAETWRLTGTPAQVSGNQRVDVIDVLNAPVVIPDGNANGRTFSATAGLDLVVERATVRISFSTTWIGDVEIYLTSPRGTVSQLIADPGGYNSSDGFDGTWTFESQAFRGERDAGAWTVRMVDDGWGDSLSVSDVVIRTFGAVSNHDRFVFTDEYSDYDGVAGHARSIVDMNGGADTVNASAVRTGSVIRLDTGPSSIDGVTVRFRNRERHRWRRQRPADRQCPCKTSPRDAGRRPHARRRGRGPPPRTHRAGRPRGRSGQGPARQRARRRPLRLRQPRRVPFRRRLRRHPSGRRPSGLRRARHARWRRHRPAQHRCERDRGRQSGLRLQRERRDRHPALRQRRGRHTGAWLHQRRRRPRLPDQHPGRRRAGRAVRGRRLPALMSSGWDPWSARAPRGLRRDAEDRSRSPRSRCRPPKVAADGHRSVRRPLLTLPGRVRELPTECRTGRAGGPSGRPRTASRRA
jgi:subtilisin-like proprotein convertase family protein